MTEEQEQQVPLKGTPGNLKGGASIAAASIGLLGGLLGLGGFFRPKFVIEAYATEFEVFGYGSKAVHSWQPLAIRDSHAQAEQVVAEMRRRLPGGAWLGCFRVVEEALSKAPAEDLVLEAEEAIAVKEHLTEKE